MYRLKGCRKCQGDMYLDSYPDQEWVCLQCGWRVPAEAIQQLPYVHPQTWMYKGEVTR